jgi:hypothetical protein
MAGEGEPFPAEEKGAERLFTRLSILIAAKRHKMHKK